ncbi:hypothetical protein ES708_10574 [subsurface metagenome]
MRPLQTDLSIFEKFKFERPPVGVRYLPTKPEGIERIGEKLNICQMLPEAHKGEPFYAQKEDITCVGSLYLGMRDLPAFESGRVGPKLGIYKDRRANEKIYRLIARLPKGSIKYVAFAPLDKLSFDPDVLILTGNVEQAEILLRATTYRLGGVFCGRTSNGVGCNWVFVYPYISGEVNFTVTGLGFGLGLPNGLIIVSIPYNLLPETIANLREMEWRAPQNVMSADELKKRTDEIHEEILAEIGEKL